MSNLKSSLIDLEQFTTVLAEKYGKDSRVENRKLGFLDWLLDRWESSQGWYL